MLLAGAGVLALATQAAAEQAETPTADSAEVAGIVVTGASLGVPLSTKTDTPLMETPQAVSVVQNELLIAQGVTRLADALRNVAGVTRSSTYGFYDSYQIRGYDAAYGSFFLDGLTSANVAGAVNELAGLEQIEVIKGPASALYGASPLGGIVNLVSKRPKADTFLDVRAATGSYDLREVVADANAPLTSDGTLLGRLNLVYREGDDFVDFAHSQRFYVAPALTWVIGDRTRLTLLSRYQRDKDSPWSPVSAWGTILPSAHGETPIDFAVNGPGPQKAVFNQKSKQIGYALVHEFTDTVRFTQNLRFEDRSVYWDRWIFAAGFVDGRIENGVQQGHVLGRFVYGPFSQRDKDFAADTRLAFEVDQGAVRHSITTGVDYRRNTNETAGDGNYNAADNPLDILAPDYLAPYVRDPMGAYNTSAKSSQLGFYLHDHVRIGERLTLTLGGRWDNAKAGDQEDSKFSPHAGVTWALTPEASLYGSFSRSFTPTPSWQTDSSGALLPPETGENIEAGVKVQHRSGRLSGAIAVYQLTRRNVATADPASPFFYVVTGEQRSRGVEVEGTWRPVDGLELIGAYARIDAEVTKDNSIPVGTPLANFPRNGLSLWGKYTLQDGPLAGFGVSLGVVHNSRKHFWEGAVYDLPGYTIFDAGVSYAAGPWTVQLNVENLTDERYFPDGAGLDRITPGEPRNWRLSLRRMF
jgi:iron complex outermembrane receptor protein